MGLALQGVSHAYGDHKVFDDLSVTVSPGEIVCLLGPSGCGKTTLLRLAAGLEFLQAGTIKFSGEVVADNNGQIPPERRGVGLMFQDFSLFPHLTVSGNVAFGLTKMRANEREQRITEVLEQVNMIQLMDTYPHTLSGGQQQRLALARALAPRPAVMLLDEPFSGLDQGMRIQIREETLGILKVSGAATLLVTHDADEAMFMADRILIMGPTGILLQEGTPDDIYRLPTHPFVASLFGQVNRLSGVVFNEEVATPLGIFPALGYEDGCELDIIVRPDGIKLSEGGKYGVPVEVINARPVGPSTFVRFCTSVQNTSVQEFHCRQVGAFSTTSDSKIKAIVEPESIFIYRRDKFDS